MLESESQARESFNQAVVPHLDAAYNLARWLAKNEHDAEDIVQEACLRALKYIRSRGEGDSRAWLLRIVRNTFYDSRRHSSRESAEPFDTAVRNVASSAPGPETDLFREMDVELLRNAIQDLPDEYREVIVLREMEGLQYENIAEIANIPMGTVMSRLSRARTRLQEMLTQKGPKGAAK